MIHADSCTATLMTRLRFWGLGLRGFGWVEPRARPGADTQVPLLLPDDVLLPFFIRLGYTNLQDRLTYMGCGSTWFILLPRIGQPHGFINLKAHACFSLTIRVQKIFASVGMPWHAIGRCEKLILQEFRYQSPAWKVPEEDSLMGWDEGSPALGLWEFWRHPLLGTNLIVVSWIFLFPQFPLSEKIWLPNSWIAQLAQELRYDWSEHAPIHELRWWSKAQDATSFDRPSDDDCSL